MITLSALAVTLFFGGWYGPWAPLGPLWFLIKLLIIIFFFLWLRATLPRLRYDQLMRFGWKVLLPVATINALVTAGVGWARSRWRVGACDADLRAPGLCPGVRLRRPAVRGRHEAESEPARERQGLRGHVQADLQET